MSLIASGHAGKLLPNAARTCGLLTLHFIIMDSKKEKDSCEAKKPEAT